MTYCYTAKLRRALEYCFVSSGLPNTIRLTNKSNAVLGNLDKAGFLAMDYAKSDNFRLITCTEIPLFAKLLYYGLDLIIMDWGWGWG